MSDPDAPTLRALDAVYTPPESRAGAPARASVIPRRDGFTVRVKDADGLVCRDFEMSRHRG